MQGFVIYFNKEKGYGFINTKEYSKNIFVHFSEIENGKSLSQGQSVEFKIKETSKGVSAVDVIAGAKQKSPYFIFGVISAIFVAVIFYILYFYQNINSLVSYLIAVNLTIFIFYGYDKYISTGDRLRVPEYNLHALALLGGSPAGLFAQKLFRHKTIKSSFQVVYWLIVVLQIGLLYWLR